MALVEVERSGDVAIVALHRPEKLNALSTALEEALGAALGSDPVTGSRAVVFVGRGRAFSAGADVTEMRDQTPASVLSYYRTTGAVYERVASLPQPTVAAIHGYCLGGGLELALACDVRVADATSTFGFPEVELGIVPSSGGLLRLVRAVGVARAKELVLVVPRFGAADALAFGLVTEMVEGGEAEARAIELAARLAALPPLAAEVATKAIEAAAESSGEAVLLIERLAYTALAQTAEHRAAADAFARRGDDVR